MPRRLLPALLIALTAAAATRAADLPPPAPALPGGTEPQPAPALWAPGLINTGMITRDVAMTPDMREIYFCLATTDYSLASICVTRWDGRAWTPPEVAPFSGDPRWLDLEPFVSPCGRRLYFMSTRPGPAGRQDDQDLWVVDRLQDGWSSPRNLGAPVNTGLPEFFPAVTADGALYFTRADSAGIHAVWRAEPLGAGFAEPRRLPAAVNCGSNRFNATIDPDESRLILTATGMPGRPAAAYYLVLRDGDDRWSEPIDLGPAVNDEVGRGWSPYVSPDGRTFFFMSCRRVGGAQPGWPRTWSELQAAHLQPGGGAGGIWVMQAGFLDSLAAGRPAPASAPSASPSAAAGEPLVPQVAFSAPGEPYFGQAAPGRRPVVFAPGLVSTGLAERDIAFTDAGRQAWFGVMAQGLVTVLTTRLEAGVWSEPITAPFHREAGFACFEPAFFADGRGVLFLTNQAAPGQTQGRGWANQNIFRSRRGEDGLWAAPQALPPPVTTDAAEYFPSLARDGTLYFTREDSAGNGAIWTAEPLGDSYAEPVRLGAEVNCGRSNFNATIEPAERWLIVCVQGRPDNLGEIDYWISFRGDDGRWLPAVNLGPDFNGPDTQAASASLSPDGRHLFFSSRRALVPPPDGAGRLTRQALLQAHAGPGGGGSDLWWVAAERLEDLRASLPGAANH